MPLLDLLKGNKKERKLKPFEFPIKIKKAFNSIKLAFTNIPIFIYYNPAIPTTVEIDILRYGVRVILS